jgi:hypothetical protein
MSRPKPSSRHDKVSGDQEEIAPTAEPAVHMGASLRKVRLGSGMSLREVAG